MKKSDCCNAEVEPDDELLTIKHSEFGGVTNTIFTVHGHYYYLDEQSKKLCIDNLKRWIADQENTTNQE